MQSLLLAILTTSITMALIGFGYILLIPKLARSYSPKGLYAVWLVILLGFLIPFRPAFPQSIFSIKGEVMNHTFTLPQREETTSPAAQAGQNIPQPMESPLPPKTPTENLPLPEGLQALPPLRGEPSLTNAQKMPDNFSIDEPPIIQEAPPPSSAPFTLSLWQLIIALWFGGGAAFLLWHIINHVRFIKKVNRWKVPITQGAIAGSFTQLKKDMHITGPIALYHCPAVSTPMLIGYIKPKILLPLLSNRDTEMTYILKHELTHFKQKDLWIKALMLLATAIHWFNPVVYVLMNHITLWCELSCDARTVENTNLAHRSAYCEAILDVARHHTSGYTAFSTPFIGGKKTMKTRIFSILDMKSKKIGLFLLALTLAATLSTSLILSSSGKASTTKGEGVTGFTKEQFEPFEQDPTFVASPVLMKTTFYALTASGGLYTWHVNSPNEQSVTKVREMSVANHLLASDNQWKDIPVTHLLTNGPVERELWLFNDRTGNIGTLTDEGPKWETFTLKAFSGQGDYQFEQGFIHRSSLYSLCQKKNVPTENSYLLSHALYDGQLEKAYEMPGALGIYPYKPNQALVLRQAHSPSNQTEGPGLLLASFNFSTGNITPLPHPLIFDPSPQNQPAKEDAATPFLKGIAYDEDRDIIYYIHNQKLFASVQGSPFTPIGDMPEQAISSPHYQRGWVLPDGRYAFGISANTGENHDIQAIHVISPSTMEAEIVDFSNHQAMLFPPLIDPIPPSNSYTSEPMYLYDQPDESAPKLMEYFQSAPLTVLETLDDPSWVKVRMGSVNGGYLDGYMKEALLAYKHGQTHYSVQSFQDEYLVVEKELPLYASPDVNGASTSLAINTPISIIGQQGDWLHIRISPTRQAEFVPMPFKWKGKTVYNYHWLTPEANNDTLVTGFIHTKDRVNTLKRFYRAVIDADDTTSPLSLLYADDYTKPKDPILVNGVEVFAFESSASHDERNKDKVINIIVPTEGTWLEGTIGAHNLAQMYYFANHPQTLIESTLQSNTGDAIPLYTHYLPLQDHQPIAAYPKDTPVTILGFFPSPGRYFVEIEGNRGYVDQGHITLPTAYTTPITNSTSTAFVPLAMGINPIVNYYDQATGAALAEKYLHLLGRQEYHKLYSFQSPRVAPFNFYMGLAPAGKASTQFDYPAYTSQYVLAGLAVAEDSKTLSYQGKKIRLLFDTLVDPAAADTHWLANIRDRETLFIENVYYNPSGEVDLVTQRDYNQADSKGEGKLTGFVPLDPAANNSPPGEIVLTQGTSVFLHHPTHYEGNTISLYSQPNEQATVLMKYETASPALLLETVNDTWAKVQVGSVKGGNKVGYVKNEFLSTSESLQSWQKEYLTSTSDVLLYNTPDKAAEGQALALHTPISVMSQYGDWWHVQIMPHHQAQSHELGYYYPPAMACDEALVTGFIYKPNAFGQLFQVYRAVIDVKDQPSLTVTPPSDSLTTPALLNTSFLLLNGTQVFSSQPSFKEPKDVSIFVYTPDGGIRVSIESGNLNYRYHHPSSSLSALVPTLLQNSSSSDKALIPLNQDPLGIKQPIDTFAPGTPVVILGKILSPNEAYLAKVNGLIGYIAPEHIVMPKEYQASLGISAPTSTPVSTPTAQAESLPPISEDISSSHKITYDEYYLKPGAERLSSQETAWFQLLNGSYLSTPLGENYFSGGQNGPLPTKEKSKTFLGRVAYFPMDHTEKDETLIYERLENRDYRSSTLSTENIGQHFKDYVPLGLFYASNTASFSFQGLPVRQWVDFYRAPIAGKTDWITNMPPDSAITIYETYYNEEGILDLYLIRDYTQTDEKGIGKLIGISLTRPLDLELLLNRYFEKNKPE